MDPPHLFDMDDCSSREDQADRMRMIRISREPRGFRLMPERLEKILVDLELSPEETELLHDMVITREPALAWSFKDRGELRPELCPPIKAKQLTTKPGRPHRTPAYELCVQSVWR